MSEIIRSELNKIYREAKSGVPTVSDSVKSLPNETLADLIKQRLGKKLIWDDAIGAFWMYVPPGYYAAMVSDKNMKEWTASMLMLWHQKGLTDGKLTDILKQLSWHADRTDDLEDEFVSFNDCVWSPVTGETLTHDPSRIATLHVPVNYADVLKAESPKLDKYLAETCLTETGEHDPGMAAQLQEFAGYLLWPKVENSICLFLQGEGSNGKSVYLDVLRGLVGTTRHRSIGLKKLMTDKFSLANLAGVRLNAADETGNCREATTPEFKVMVEGGTVDAERKFGESFNLKINAKFAFSTNPIPAFGEVNVAMRRRLMIIPFFRDLSPFTEEGRSQTIRHYGKKLIAAEFPGIVRWAMSGLDRLKANRFWYTETESSNEMMCRFESASSSVVEYLREKFEPCEDGFYAAVESYEDYVEWTKKNGRKAVAKNGLGAGFTAAFGKNSVRKVNGKSIRGYRCRCKSPDNPLF